MTISPLQPKIDTSHVDIESLAGNQSLSQDQKIAEASKQFEAILLRQFLSESQKPMVQGELEDDSTTSSIYQDMISNQLSESLSSGNGIGLAKMFEHQLTPRHSTISPPVSKP